MNMSFFKSLKINNDIIQCFCQFIQEQDLYNLCNSDNYLFCTISNSTPIFKAILQRESNYLTPKCMIIKNNCSNLICNMNDPMLIYKQWFRSSRYSRDQSKIILKFQDKTFQQYILYKPIWHKLFFNNELFRTIYRVLSFKYWSQQTLINLFDDAEYYLKTRTLNHLEKKLFNAVELIQYNNNKINIHLQENPIKFKLNPVIKFEQFKKNFNDLYFFDEWSNYINWNYFIISGSSVLATVINKNWTNEPHHDIDIYSHTINIVHFRKLINIMHLSFQNCGHLYVDHGTFVTFELYGKNMKRIRLQFIFTCQTITILTLNRIIENFDLDICQLLYNVKENKIFCTGAFIQSLQTEYIVPYCLIINKNFKQIKQISRIIKYFKKGFQNMLIPKNLPVKRFEEIINYYHDKIENLEIEAKYCSKIIPCDFFEVQKNLLKILHK